MSGSRGMGGGQQGDPTSDSEETSVTSRITSVSVEEEIAISDTENEGRAESESSRLQQIMRDLEEEDEQGDIDIKMEDLLEVIDSEMIVMKNEQERAEMIGARNDEQEDQQQQEEESPRRSRLNMSDWDDVAWVHSLDSVVALKKIPGYETFSPVCRFDDAYDELKKPDVEFPVRALPKMTSLIPNHRSYSPKFVMRKGDAHHYMFEEMEQEMKIYYNPIRIGAVVPHEKQLIGMYAILWDMVDDGSMYYRRVKIIDKRFKVPTPEEYKIFVDIIDHGYSIAVPWSRILFMEQRFTKLPRRVLFVQLDNVKAYKHDPDFSEILQRMMPPEADLSMKILKSYNNYNQIKLDAIVHIGNMNLIHGVTGAAMGILAGRYNDQFHKALCDKLPGVPLAVNCFAAFVMHVNVDSGDVFVQSDSPFYRHFQLLYNEKEGKIVELAGKCKEVISETFYFAPYKDGLYYRCVLASVNRNGTVNVDFVDEGDTATVPLKTLVLARDVHPLFDLFPVLGRKVKLYVINQDKKALKILKELMDKEKSTRVVVELQKVEQISEMPSPSLNEVTTVRVPYVTLYGEYQFVGDENVTFSNLNDIAIKLSRKESPQKRKFNPGIPPETGLLSSNDDNYQPPFKIPARCFNSTPTR